jgi:hypothetical protein
MMGSRERHFAPLMAMSLEELVPADHFYRHVERMLDLSFVRELVQQTYAGIGRPSIDPVVFFKLQLVMFFGAPFYVVRHFCEADKDGRRNGSELLGLQGRAMRKTLLTPDAITCLLWKAECD